MCVYTSSSMHRSESHPSDYRSIKMAANSSTTPFLSNSKSTDDHKRNPSTLDDILESSIGENLTKAQFIQAFLITFTWFFDAQQLFITVFSDAVPPWHCIDKLSCNSSSNICQLAESSWAWDKPVRTSTVSEWSLQCNNSVLSGLPASSFFMGCLFGGFLLVPLADSLGRKKALLISCLGMSIPAFLAAFSPNVWIYSVLKFLSGFFRASVASSILVLPSEILGRKWRKRVGVLGFNFSTLGFLSLPGIAYLNRSYSWRILYLTTSIPAILYCIVIHILAWESPRWLLMREREEEAVTILNKYASFEGFASFESRSFHNLRLVLQKQDQRRTDDMLSSVKLLLGTKWALQRLLITMVIGFGIGASYFGMPQDVNNLTSNLYLSVALNVLMEVPSNSITLFLIGKWTTRSLLLVIATLSGFCSISYAFLGDHVKILHVGVELASFSGVTASFTLFLVYALEMFPTCIRNSAMCFLRQAAVVGGIFSPLLIALARHNTFVVYGVFGILLLVSGVFVVCLPVTKDATLCDTMEEQELLEKEAFDGIYC